jgi:hypothetical protein
MPVRSASPWHRRLTTPVNPAERAALKELLSSLDLDGVLIQADALHTTQSFFTDASPREPTYS